MSYYCNECGDDITYRVFRYSQENYGRPLCMDCQEEEAEYDDFDDEYGGSNHGENRPETPQEWALHKALSKLGIKHICQYDDGYKSVDIGIPWARLYIEVDGAHHEFNMDQILRDMDRDEYSRMDGFKTIHVPNYKVEEDAYRVAEKIARIAKKRSKKRW